MYLYLNDYLDNLFIYIICISNHYLCPNILLHVTHN
uniref:Uncharacterized protein n=1 Tax=Histiona aroides TaxID=392300 RepID=M4QD08_HISAR|nr:hypothetical protein L075_p028 [Histiona aroides]AGH24075.1 hypothetical protein [Histiona aroides]